MATLRWLGHAAVELNISGKKILIDPLLSQNPLSPLKPDYYKGNVDLIIVTHDHYDHLGDAVDILKSTPKAKLFANYDLEMYLVNQYKISEDQLIPANVGGYVEFDSVKLALTPAIHSSEHGDPNGTVISGDGVTVYHAGDTGLFADMKTIGDVFKPDYALLPIGGRFTMDPTQASIAVELLRPKKAAIPIHYNTWDLIKVNELDFERLVKSKGFNAIILKPGQEIEL